MVYYVRLNKRSESYDETIESIISMGLTDLDEGKRLPEKRFSGDLNKFQKDNLLEMEDVIAVREVKDKRR